MANKYAVETAFKLIDNATAPLAKIGVKGNAVGKQLKKDFMKAQDQLAGIGQAAKKAGIAIVAVGAAAAGAFAVKGLKDAIELNTEITKIATVADMTGISLGDLSKKLLEVSNATGVSASELAKFQYQAITAGIKTADSADFVAAAVRVSKAAFTDTETAIDGLTKVMNAYQLDAAQADRIAGQMYLTTTMGKTSFEELNSSLGRVLPTAARMNVQTDELFASIASLTANAIETPKAVKGIEKIFEQIQNPTDKVSKAARRLGIDFSAAALESKGLAGFLKDIQDKTGGSEAAIMELFGSVEALNVVNVLTTRGVDTFNQALGEMGNAAGAVDKAFNKVMESPAQRWANVMNRIKNAGINLGTALLPMVEKIMGKVEEFAKKLGDIDFEPIAEKAGVVFDKLMGFAGFIGNLISLIWKLRVPILAVVGAVALYKGGMLVAAAAVNTFTAAQKIAKGVQLAAALITGNQTKAMAIYKAGTMGASIQTMLFAARQKIAMGVGFVGSLIKQGAAFLALKAQMIASTVATIAHGIAQKAVAVASGIATAAQWALNAAMSANPIGLIILGVIALIAAIVLLVKNWDTVVAALKKAFSAIGNFFVMIWEGIKSFFVKVVDFVKKNALNILNVILGILFFPAGVIMAVVRLIIKHWDKIKEALLSVWGQFENRFPGLANVISTVFNKVKDIISAAIENVKAIFNGFKNFFIGLWDALKQGPAATLEYIKNAFFGLFDTIKEKFFGFIDVIKNGWETVKGFFSGLGDKVGNFFSGNKNTAVSPQVQNIVPPALKQTTTTTAGMPSNVATNMNRNNQTITAATAPATRPMTTGEQYSYSQTTNREEVDIAVRADQGTQARVTRQPRSPNIRVAASGGN